jgi:hypothetical protein
MPGAAAASPIQVDGLNSRIVTAQHARPAIPTSISGLALAHGPSVAVEKVAGSISARHQKGHAGNKWARCIRRQPTGWEGNLALPYTATSRRYDLAVLCNNLAEKLIT